jgi:hypothetical protein
LHRKLRKFYKTSKQLTSPELAGSLKENCKGICEFFWHVHYQPAKPRCICCNDVSNQYKFEWLRPLETCGKSCLIDSIASASKLDKDRIYIAKQQCIFNHKDMRYNSNQRWYFRWRSFTGYQASDCKLAKDDNFKDRQLARIKSIEIRYKLSILCWLFRWWREGRVTLLWGREDTAGGEDRGGEASSPSSKQTENKGKPKIDGG